MVLQFPMLNDYDKQWPLQILLTQRLKRFVESTKQNHVS